jgi:hypothetical protein
MGVDIADACAKQSAPLNEQHHITVSGDLDAWQFLQLSENHTSPSNTAQRNLPNDEWVRHCLFARHEGRENLVGDPQMAHPNRRIN